MGIAFAQVDAFTDQPFAGNPAAICALQAPADAAWMQAVAREMNLSETAFLVRRPDGDFDLRWFTPGGESDLCGHATLASAHLLWQDGHLRPDEQGRFHTRSGLLTAARAGDWIELDFPAAPPVPVAEPEGLGRALGLPLHDVYRSQPQHGDQYHYVVEVASEQAVRELAPDFAALRAVPIIAVAVTSRADTPGYDFVSRFFAPISGIDEDPVTGSVHCTLGPYWKQRLGKDTFVAYQASARGGVVRVRLAGDRVLLGGQAVTVLRGELL
jgi:PhzF family phenazine biosynthesis protein